MTTLPPTQKRRLAQKKFIDECMATHGTLADVLKQSGLTTRQLAAWLRDKSFRKRLHRLQDLLRTARQLDIDLLARQAVDAIRPDVADAKDARRAAIDILKLARASEARQRMTNRKEKVLPALTHPEVDNDTARELIAQLDR